MIKQFKLMNYFRVYYLAAFLGVGHPRGCQNIDFQKCMAFFFLLNQTVVSFILFYFKLKKVVKKRLFKQAIK